MPLNAVSEHASHAAGTAAEPTPDLRALAGREGFSATLELRHAGLRRVRIRYEWQGPEDAPLLIVAGGISAHRHLGACERFPEPGWWSCQAGAGLALDTCQFRLLAIDWLGADGELDLPIDSADQADAIAAVLDRIGVRRARAFVGCSYGAMVGLQFAARHGHRLGSLLAISGGAGAHPYSSAWRALQRRILALGRSEGGSREALSLARQLALLSYRTPEEFAERFGAPVALVDGRARCAAEDWLEARGAHYVARTAPTAFARLSESIDLHALEPAAVRVPTVLVAVEEDRLVPRADLVALAEQLPDTRRLHLLRSRFGHDAFLTEHEAIAAILRATLAEARP
ncbi:MAG: homoserine O-succinyltransferase [Arenimonas sp.]